MQFGLLSSKQEEQDRARKLLTDHKDRGASWLKGGWKDEPDAATMGSDVGTEGGGEWITKKRDAMEKISEELDVFSRI